MILKLIAQITRLHGHEATPFLGKYVTRFSPEYNAGNALPEQRPSDITFTPFAPPAFTHFRSSFISTAA